MSEFAIKLIEEEKKKKTGKLNLGNCGLRNIPKELFELYWLEELSFRNSFLDIITGAEIIDNNLSNQNFLDLEVLPPDFERLSCLKKLSFGGSAVLKWNLGNINILNTLKYLQTLDLSYNKIRDIQILENQNGLQSLILRNNNISDIRILKYLTKLNSLDLSCNKINDFQYLENLTGLQTLNLSNNNISDIRFLVKLTGLITLNISSNCIRFTGSLNKLNNLQTLNIRNNSISNINFLKHLPTLYSIDLGLNRIKNYSNLACLTRLHTLNLSDNHLSDIHFIEKLTCLNSLVLYNNKIDDIRFLDKLIGLQSLNLSFNQIYDISYLENLTELQSLNLRSNLISNIRNLENLSKLQKLDLAFNHINDILPLLPLLKKGLLISIDWGEKGSLIDINHISIPPESIFKAGKIAVINWFEQIKDGKAPLFEAKIMILGQGGAGKTTFAHLQLDTKFKVKPGKLVSTLGIVVHLSLIHISEPTRLGMISYAVFCLKK